MSGLRLQNGDRVIIAGGGPAGSFAALHLLKLAQQEGIDCSVDIYEPRDFFTPGAAHNCKGCAGILSAGALRNIASLGLTIPQDVIQSELKVYQVHVAGQVTTLAQPGAERRIISVYRGGGPRRHRGLPLTSFDGFLLGHALAAGARHVPERIRKVTWDSRPVVHTDAGSETADLLVVATGVNSRSPLDPGFGYQPPSSAVMVQDEIRRPADWPEDTVAGFFGRPTGLLFGALVPKGEYLNVSLLWAGAAHKHPASAKRQFYEAHASTLGAILPLAAESFCGCNPRILTGAARGYYGDRWVAVGDAAVSHLYKDGIHSAFLTAREAMTAAVAFGIGRGDFDRAYRPTCAQIALDNRFGALLFAATSKVLRPERFMRAFGALVAEEAGSGAGRALHARLLWGMLTGDESYLDLFRLALRPQGALAFAREVLRA